jgi:hypothetical protein
LQQIPLPELDDLPPLPEYEVPDLSQPLELDSLDSLEQLEPLERADPLPPLRPAIDEDAGTTERLQPDRLPQSRGLLQWKAGAWLESQ